MKSSTATTGDIHWVVSSKTIILFHLMLLYIDASIDRFKPIMFFHHMLIEPDPRLWPCSPTQAIFTLFDDLLVLQRGKVVYFGHNGDPAAAYFDTLSGVRSQ